MTESNETGQSSDETTADVVVSDTPFVDVGILADHLSDVGVTIDAVDTTDEATLRRRASDAAALILDVNSPLPADVVADLDSLEVVARAGMGLDNVDVDAARAAGVTVTNAPDYGVDEVATHAVSLLLSCRRGVAAHDRDVRGGEWNWRTDRPQPRIRGSTLGLVSFGDTARRVVDLTRGFEFDVLVYDPYVDDGTVEAAGATRVDFETLLADSDMVSIHAPLTEDTRGMFDAAAFERLPDHAVVVNVGRGGIVDERALAEALAAGEVAAAGLDVLAVEPPDEDNPLCGRDDVVVTPHTAWYSADARERLNRTVAEDVRRVLTGVEPEHPVASGPVGAD
ncbi:MULTISPECIES: C-terminal binding protein [Salinibaculum]|uniref:C-terminal binding protein n=1 Tax=Salinibaculum TaxID=2732368 RepID=UPI0030D46502